MASLSLVDQNKVCLELKRQGQCLCLAKIEVATESVDQRLIMDNMAMNPGCRANFAASRVRMATGIELVPDTFSDMNFAEESAEESEATDGSEIGQG